MSYSSIFFVSRILHVVDEEQKSNSDGNKQFRHANDEIKDKDVLDDIPEALGIHRKTFHIGIYF